MTEYRIEWAQCPTNYNLVNVLFVEAADEHNARLIACDHIERTYGIGRHSVLSIRPASVVPAGQVKALGETEGR